MGTAPLIQTLHTSRRLDRAQWRALLTEHTPKDDAALSALARQTAQAHFGNRVYARGLIEFTNHCRQNCRYCGIRRANRSLQRYRLTADEILACCTQGHALGLRTFVLQGGEDAGFSDALLCRTVEQIKTRFPDCAVTLSVGERPPAVYQSFFDAGADRYLLRHETADADQYRLLHPPALSLEHRMSCLYLLKEIGFQVGAGFLVGAPGETTDTVAENLLFLQDLQPHMVGIGPFLPHHQTPFAARPPGSTVQTLFLLSCIRLMLPQVLLPATTALGTASADGREQGILAGANVVMPNLSPAAVRDSYALYDHKLSSGGESAECLPLLQRRLSSIGYTLSLERGDSPLCRKD